MFVLLIHSLVTSIITAKKRKRKGKHILVSLVFEFALPLDGCSFYLQKGDALPSVDGIVLGQIRIFNFGM